MTVGPPAPRHSRNSLRPPPISTGPAESSTPALGGGDPGAAGMQAETTASPTEAATMPRRIVRMARPRDATRPIMARRSSRSLGRGCQRGPERLIVDMVAGEGSLAEADEGDRGGEGGGEHQERQRLRPNLVELHDRHGNLRENAQDQRGKPVEQGALAV